MHTNTDKLLERALDIVAKSTRRLTGQPPHIATLWLASRVPSTKRPPGLTRWLNQGVEKLLKHMRTDGQVPYRVLPKLLFLDNPEFDNKSATEVMLLSILAHLGAGAREDEVRRLVGFIYSKGTTTGVQQMNVQGSELQHEKDFMVHGDSFFRRSLQRGNTIWLLPQIIMLEALERLQDRFHWLSGNATNLRVAIDSRFGNYATESLGGPAMSSMTYAYYERVMRKGSNQIQAAMPNPESGNGIACWFHQHNSSLKDEWLRDLASRSEVYGIETVTIHDSDAQTGRFANAIAILGLL